MYVVLNPQNGLWLALPDNPNRVGSRSDIKPFPPEWVRDLDQAARFDDAERACSQLLTMKGGYFRFVRLLTIKEAWALDKPNGFL